MADTVEGRRADGPEPSLDDDDRQEIRIAVVMNGGVSLAIWISGVTLELHRLATARAGAGSPYAPLLDLLHADACVDVIAGTSAGGLNGAFLALGLARGRSLSSMRDLWLEHGSLDKLLREPLARNPRSLLKGDDYFLLKVREALESIAGDTDRPVVVTDGAAPAVELVLTGTLWQGRSTTFTDDMGTGITETDHDATFRFTTLPAACRQDGSGCGDLAADTVLDELAVAARCTSSFPGAFEPHFVTVISDQPGSDLRWDSTAGRANFRERQYVVDGGVLLNKPIRPALEAVYRQTAGFQVRRVLAYVVPDPGERPHPAVVIPSTDASPPTEAVVPSAREVVLGVLTRLRSTDSVSRELAEIRARNTDVRTRRLARDRFATALLDAAERLPERAWPAYLEARVENAAHTLAPLLAAGQRGQPADRWSVRELTAALHRQRASLVPQGSLADALLRVDDAWDWGQTTVQRLAEMTIDLLKRAVWLAPLRSPQRAAIIRCRRSVRDVLTRIQADRRDLNAYWSTAPTGVAELGLDPMPTRRGPMNRAADNLPELEAWLASALHAWDAMRTPDGVLRRAHLYRQALDLAGHLRCVAPAVRAVSAAGNPVLDPDGEWAARLAGLHRFLLPPRSPEEPAPSVDPEPDTVVSAESVLRNALRLDVVQLAFTGASREPEQEVELVQVSSLDPERLTGIQLHHFGAFYRGSWRMNDWLQGRMDGVAQLVRVLLSPERLRQCALADAPATTGHPPDPAGIAARLLAHVQRLAVPEDSPDLAWLRERWAQDRQACADEVERLVAGGPVPSLDACARAVARPVQTGVLREDLLDFAEAVRAEGDDRAEAGTAWLASVDAAVAATGKRLPAAELWRLWREAGKVGGERVEDEVGSDTFARVLSHAAAVAAGTVGDVARVRPLAAVLAAFRGYALAVWAMVTALTRRSAVGAHTVEMAVAAGTVLLAVTLLVPAVPVGLILLGVLLLLSGLTSAALLSPGARPVGTRLAAATLVVLVTLGGYLWWAWSHTGSAALVWNVLIKLGVAVLVVLLGWWVARAGPRRPRNRARSRR